jgi:hypothetical protein
MGYNTYTHGNVTRKLCVAILNKQKCLFFFFDKTGEQEGRTSPAGENWYPWGGRECGESVFEVNMVQILCTRM